MDHLEVGMVVDYCSRLRDLRERGPRDEDDYYERHAPKEYRAWPLVPALAVIGFSLVAGLMVAA